MQTWQISDKTSRPNIGSTNNEELSNLLGLVDDKFDSPLKTTLSGSVLYISSPTKQTIESDGLNQTQASYKVRLPVVGGIDYSTVLASSIDLASGITTGSFNSALETGVLVTANAYIQMGVALRSDKKLYVVWGTEGSTAALSTPPAFADDDIQIVVVKLQNNGTAGNWNFIAPIKTNIERVQLGGSGGGGSGNVGKIFSYVQENMGSEFWPYSHAAYADFYVDKKTKTDPTSTAILDTITKAYKFTTGSEFLLTSNLLGDDFLSKGIDVSNVLMEIYTKNGLVPTLQASRDGGANYQVASLLRDGLTNRYYAEFVFSDESTQSFSKTITNTSFDVGSTAVDNSFTLLNAAYIKNLNLNVTKTNTPVGYIYVTIKDSLSNIVFSKFIDTSLLSTGVNTVDINTVLASGDYIVSFIGDDIYVLNYPSNKVSIDASGINFTGRELNLVMKIGGEAGLLVDGLGAYFGSAEFVGMEKAPIAQTFEFDGNIGQNSFEITNFSVVPELIKCYDETRGNVYSKGSFQSINGQVITFQDGLFIRPNETVKLRFEQASGYYDSSDLNAQAIAELESKTVDFIENTFSDCVLTQSIPAPYTVVVNRSKMIDIMNDNSVVGPSNRILTQKIFRILEECGPNGEQVYGVVGDKNNQIRLGGSWVEEIATNGVCIANVNTIGDFIEITFVGTGLNLLMEMFFGSETVCQLNASIDGGAFGSNIFPSVNTNILAGQNYGTNQIVPVVSGLAYGIHTVLIKKTVAGTQSTRLYGVDILNESANIVVNAGKAFINKKLVTTAQKILNFNPSLYVGSKGARVLIYKTINGEIGQTFSEVDTTALYRNSTNHTNEEMYREYHYRELGNGRVDDLSFVGGGQINTAYVMDDNTTLNVGYQVQAYNFELDSALIVGGTSNFFSFEVFCSGLDLLISSDTASRAGVIYVDGVLIDTVTIASTKTKSLPIFSGLPVGMHRVTVVNANSGPACWGISSIKAYLPKLPNLPSKSIALGEYVIMPSYLKNTIISTNKRSEGVISKLCTREFLYSGTWGNSLDTSMISGWSLTTSTAGSYLEIPFIGTGLDIRFFSGPSHVANWTVSIDGSSDLSSYSTTLNLGYAGTVALTKSTGIVAGTYGATSSYGNSLSITGLSFKQHKLRITWNSGNAFYFDAIQVITPIYFPKFQKENILQNTVNIGNCSTGDLRILSSDVVSKNSTAAISVGVADSPTTTATGYHTARDMVATVYGQNKRYKISFDTSAYNGTVGNGLYFRVVVDGKAVQDSHRRVVSKINGGYVETIAINTFVYLCKGFHSVKVDWCVSGATGYLDNSYRNLTIEEC